MISETAQRMNQKTFMNVFTYIYLYSPALLLNGTMLQGNAIKVMPAKKAILNHNSNNSTAGGAAAAAGSHCSFVVYSFVVVLPSVNMFVRPLVLTSFLRSLSSCIVVSFIFSHVIQSTLAFCLSRFRLACFLPSLAFSLARLHGQEPAQERSSSSSSSPSSRWFWARSFPRCPSTPTRST